MIQFTRSIFFIAAQCMILCACSVTKNLPENEALYVGADIKIHNDSLSRHEKDELGENLQQVITPKPNKKLLGFPFKLWVYQTFGNPKKEKGIGNFIKNKFGEPPVLASQVNLPKTITSIESRMRNNGYFQAYAKGDTAWENKKVRATYDAWPGIRYTIRRLIYQGDSASRYVNLDKEVTSKNIVLKEGDGYSFDKVLAERTRIDGLLKENGYYYFSPDNILVRVDSTVGNAQVDMFFTIKPESSYKTLQQYYINNIYIYPNYTLTHDTAHADTSLLTRHKDLLIADPLHTYKPVVFDRALLFNKGDIYTRSEHNGSLNRLVSMGTFKFVKNRFVDSDRSDSAMLDTYYYLTSAKKKSLSAEILGKTTSVNFGGMEANINWSHRNLFRGAEQMTLKFFTSSDVQFSGNNQNFNIFRLGSDISILWPRFTPFRFKESSMFTPNTVLVTGAELQVRQQLYTLVTGKAQFGYRWKEDLKREHSLNFVDAMYTDASKITPLYESQIALDSSLARVIQEQAIWGPNYSFTYTNATEPRRRHATYYNGKLESSNMLLGLVQGANAKDGNVKSIFGVNYNQYLKTEQDIRYYLRFMRDMEWANRVAVGLGIPMGNSLALPFIRQFYAGGSNTIRAFRARTIGPGTHLPDVRGGFLPDQTGDISLLLNSEVRFPIYKMVKGATFIDAGNIWLYNKDPLKPGAEFSGKFLNQLAVGGGFGLRLDLQIFIIRADIATPFKKPWLTSGSQWVLGDVNIGSQQWRRENLVFSLAIGMPF